MEFDEDWVYGRGDLPLGQRARDKELELVTEEDMKRYGGGAQDQETTSNVGKEEEKEAVRQDDATVPAVPAVSAMAVLPCKDTTNSAPKASNIPPAMGAEPAVSVKVQAVVDQADTDLEESDNELKSDTDDIEGMHSGTFC